MEQQFNLYNFYQDIKKENIMFCYSGPISQKTIEGIGYTLKMDLEIKETSMTISQSVFSIFIEQMQNVINYSAEKIVKNTEYEKELKVGIILIGNQEDRIYVYCGNKVFNSDVERLKERIEEIRFLDKDELKALYKARRKMESAEGSRGAGLGFIEMARKARKPIEYSFQNLDETFSFFAIKVLI
ncbi:MAG: SiaB family protein kinase [Lachnospiraceae bacterium]|nr:SiaB family protein kinase [Lachnospiraceae bacterium]